MASGRRGSGDRILESRHLVGLFLGVVLLCGVFFTLGYVMGRTQYGNPSHDRHADVSRDAQGDAFADSPVRAPGPARVAPKPAATGASSSSAPAPSEWDFYAKKNNDHLEPAASAAAPAGNAGGPGDPPAAETPAPNPPEAAPQPVLTPVRTASRSTPRMARGAILLQVAALRHQSDALAMAELLQKKRFPSFVAAPVAGDTLYRVQVGPYTDEHAADVAKTSLDRAGFKAIIKR